MRPTRVVAIDAGRSTGAAVVDFPANGEPVLVTALQWTDLHPNETAARLDEILWELDPHVIVVEQFDLRPGNQFVADLTTVKVNALLEYMVDGMDIVWQTPAQAKGLVKDKVLRNLDLWQTGKMVGEPDANDVNDALRHAVRYGVEVLNHTKTIERGWPKDD